MGKAHQGRRAAPALLVAAALVALLISPAFARALDDGQPGPGERWAPGQILVRFHDHVGAAERERIARAAGAKLVSELPLVRNLWELVTTAKVGEAERRLSDQRGVEYTQPNYIDTSALDDAPTSRGYWPTDPYFWPAVNPAPRPCPPSPGETNDFQRRLGSWGLWPTGSNLTDPAASGASFTPLAPQQRATFVDGQPEFASYWGIDVLPAWNVMLDEGRLWNGVLGAGERGVPREGPWTTKQIQGYGVGVMDTGISNAPDLKGKVAALFSVVQSEEKEGGDAKVLRNRVREVFADDPARAHNDDIPAVEQQIPRSDQTIVQPILRPLFVLDDPDVLQARQRPADPRGCDGHGTGVSSIVGAAANNREGTVGVGYDVPLVGIRVGEPWDKPGDPDANNDKITYALDKWSKWRGGAQATDMTRIMEYDLAKALALPVLNMSFGRPMFVEAPDSSGRERLVVTGPAILEAEADLFTSGKTLGVAAAGNYKQRYGRGSLAAGALLASDDAVDPRPVDQPCGLPLFPKVKAWKAADGADLNTRASRAIKGTAAAPFTLPGIDWSKLELICVAATTSSNSQLAGFSGSGDAAVQLAAPGRKITVAARPSFGHPNAGTYFNVNGTSVAAPMVAGAAALLRRAAPGASIDEIRRALEQGARLSLGMLGKVAYGQLDVACSLRWLLARRRLTWDLFSLTHVEQIDAAGYQNLLRATAGCGSRGEAPYVESGSLTVARGSVFAKNAVVPMQKFVSSLTLDGETTSNSLRWQDALTQSPDSAAQRVVFPMFPAHGPFAPTDRRVYPLGELTVGCSKQGYRITNVTVGFRNLFPPADGWWLPTDQVGPFKSIKIAVAVARPWYEALLGPNVVARARVRCQFFAAEGK